MSQNNDDNTLFSGLDNAGRKWFIVGAIVFTVLMVGPFGGLIYST